jgi:hypothetical protein
LGHEGVDLSSALEYYIFVRDGHTDIGMTMTLVNGRVCSEEIEVLISLGIPDMCALSSLKASTGQIITNITLQVDIHRKRMIVVTISQRYPDTHKGGHTQNIHVPCA